MGAFGPGDEEDDVMFDDLVEDYEDEDDAIDAVSHSCLFSAGYSAVVPRYLKNWQLYIRNTTLWAGGDETT